jgi:hypothetical protein
MKLIFRNYLASLRERDELDAILPDLLSELGFTVYSRPQRGTAQAGVDIAAVGKDDDGERKVFLFSVKQGDLTRQSWNDGTQALRPSLDEILDSYIPNRIPKKYQKLKIVICLVFGGDMQEQVRTAVTGYKKKYSSDKISFDEWNGDKLAGLLMQGVLREQIMPKPLRSHFQKAVALVDEPDIAFRHFERLVSELCKGAQNEKSRVRVARQLYIATWVLFVWARDVDNLEAPYQASELLILHIWNLVRPYVDKKPTAASKAILSLLQHAIRLYVHIASGLLEKKILPHAGVPDGISVAMRTRSAVDVNLKLFDLLGRVAVMGLWLYWLIERGPEASRYERAREHVLRITTMGYQLINNNRALFLPVQDRQAIDVALFLVLVAVVGGNLPDARLWLHEMVDRLALTVRTHGLYPCVFVEYRDLSAHPRESTDEYRQEATAGSILIPLLAAFLSGFKDTKALETLVSLKAEELQHCTIQLWTPDQTSEDGIYVGRHDHGIAIYDLPLSSTGKELLQTVREACGRSNDFESLSAFATGFWPVILTACRHHRLPVPPQFWINIVDPPARGTAPKVTPSEERVSDAAASSR